MAAGSVFVLILVIGLGSGLLLYSLVRSESRHRRVMDRDQAEREVRRDTRDEES